MDGRGRDYEKLYLLCIFRAGEESFVHLFWRCGTSCWGGGSSRTLGLFKMSMNEHETNFVHLFLIYFVPALVPSFAGKLGGHLSHSFSFQFHGTYWEVLVGGCGV